MVCLYSDNYVLKDVSFSVNPGDTIAIVGHTGSGKTTIISLLNRLYHIQKGAIKIDDINIENYNLESLRKNIGVVLQDVFLFSGTVMDNNTLRNNRCIMPGRNINGTPARLMICINDHYAIDREYSVWLSGGCKLLSITVPENKKTSCSTTPIFFSQ